MTCLSLATRGLYANSPFDALLLLVLLVLIDHLIEERHPRLQAGNNGLADGLGDILCLLMCEASRIKGRGGRLQHRVADLLAGILFHLEAGLVAIPVHVSPFSSSRPRGGLPFQLFP